MLPHYWCVRCNQNIGCPNFTFSKLHKIPNKNEMNESEKNRAHLPFTCETRHVLIEKNVQANRMKTRWQL